MPGEFALSPPDIFSACAIRPFFLYFLSNSPQNFDFNSILVFFFILFIYLFIFVFLSFLILLILLFLLLLLLLLIFWLLNIIILMYPYF